MINSVFDEFWKITHLSVKTEYVFNNFPSSQFWVSFERNFI